jgi:hypothetical protein
VFYGFNYGESNAKTYITLSIRLDEKKKLAHIQGVPKKKDESIALLFIGGF